MKRFLSLIAILAISLVAACAQVPPDCTKSKCKKCCPSSYSQGSGDHSKGKMCDPAKKEKRQKKSNPAVSSTPAPEKNATKNAPVAPAPAEQATIPNQEKPAGMFDGVKKIIQDVQGKDTKKPE